MVDSVETVVIGAGVVGLAVARSLAMTGRDVLILEREDAFGSITSARNSEVIHAGIYYAQNSLKARLCVAGRHLLYDYCSTTGVAHNKCGKLIVAATSEEVDDFGNIARRAWDNGVDDLKAISAADAKSMEPALECLGALLSPSTGIVDSHGLMLAYLGEAEEHGAMLVLNTPVEHIAAASSGFRIETGGNDPTTIVAREVINSAGLQAPWLARGMDGLPPRALPEQKLAKGNYFSLSMKAPFSRLIYPAPTVGGLGVHLTIDLQGRARFGPDVEWIEEEDYAVDPSRGDSFYASIRRYWPDLPDGALTPDYSGIRPKLGESKHGSDFHISSAREHGLSGYIGLYGIESPGLTSSLAIGDYVRDSLLDDVR